MDAALTMALHAGGNVVKLPFVIAAGRTVQMHATPLIGQNAGISAASIRLQNATVVG